MSWIDRQREAALTTPDGTRFVFLFEDLERSRAENASVFRFAQKSGAYIQRLSSGQDIYPLTAIFSGTDYDLVADEFWEKTKVPGVFSLEHPRFTGIKRVQLLSIRERRAAKSADNQASFDLVLHETLEIVQPTTSLDSTAQILSFAGDLSEEGSFAFEDNTKLDNAIIVTDLQQESTTFIDDMKNLFTDVAAKEAAINTAFDAQFLSVSSAVDSIVSEPLEFSSNLAVFIATPSRVAVSVNERINRYDELLNNTLARLSYSADDLLDASKNKAALATLTSLGIMSGVSQAAVTETTYTSRAEVIEIADKIIDLNDSIVAVLDEYSDQFNDETDPLDRRFEISDALNALNSLVSLTVARLFDIAFTLRQERFIILEKEYDTYNLTHKLYGFSDENLQLLIDTNQLKSNEIYLVPKGKEIVYYI
jgi:hypothetical protein